MPAERTCTVEGCAEPHRARGFCNLHYKRFCAHGDVHTVRTTAVPAVDRFWSKVDKTPGGCWLWTASLNRDGYPEFSVERRHVKAHRFAYELLVGPIEEGLVLDHLCRVRRCVNPAHLEPVTHIENVRRANLAERFCESCLQRIVRAGAG